MEMHKSLSIGIEKGSADDEFVAVITTDVVDRDKEVILPKGMDTERFMKTNPVLLFGHNRQDLTVGRAMWMKDASRTIDGAKRQAKLMGFKVARTDMGKDIQMLLEDGMLNAVSVGFEASDYGIPEEKEIVKRPELAGVRTIFRKTELNEVSLVPIPANQQAIVERSKALCQDTRDALCLDKLQPEKPKPPTVKVDKVIRPTPWRRHIVPGPFSMAFIEREIADELAIRMGKVR